MSRTVKFKIPTTPKQIDALIDSVYNAHFCRRPINVMDIPKLFTLARHAYITAMVDLPLTPESLAVARERVREAIAASGLFLSGEEV